MYLVDIRTKYQFRGTQFFYLTLHKMTTKAPDCIFSRQLLARPLVGNTNSISYHLRSLNTYAQSFLCIQSGASLGFLSHGCQTLTLSPKVEPGFLG